MATRMGEQMNKQPEALRLADALQSEEYFARGPLAMEAVAELRRLHEVNMALIEACQIVTIAYDKLRPGYSNAGMEPLEISIIRAAIAKNTGEQ